MAPGVAGALKVLERLESLKHLQALQPVQVQSGGAPPKLMAWKGAQAILDGWTVSRFCGANGGEVWR